MPTVGRALPVRSNVPLPEPFVIGLVVAWAAGRAWPLRGPGQRPIPVVGTALAATGSWTIAQAWLAAGDVDLAEPGRLVTHGPYRRMRHPMYVGWALLHLGAALVSRNG
ncbi:methyltransferase family protein [Georgenia yuyongxinii]